jgi:ferredoxin
VLLQSTEASAWHRQQQQQQQQQQQERGSNDIVLPFDADTNCGYVRASSRAIVYQTGPKSGADLWQEQCQSFAPRSVWNVGVARTGQCHCARRRYHVEFRYYTKSQSSTLLDLVKDPTGAEVLSEYLEAACGGNASCSTCHVYIDANTATACGIELSDVSEAELDMLDYAFQANETSRLACQVRVQCKSTSSAKTTIKTNGASLLPKLEVVIPSDANNLWK